MTTGKPGHPAALADEDLLADCDLRRQRRSGPGGQHRNKVETAVVMTHRPTGIQGGASERRSQEENRQEALFRLRVNLALGVRTAVPGDSSPSERWRSRCREGRLAVNPRHADFPSLLAEALDHLAAHDWEVPPAAQQLGISASQLVKLLQHDGRALAELNAQRATRGKRSYR